VTETPGDGAQIGGAYFGLGFDFSQLERDLDRAESVARARVAQIQHQLDQISRSAGRTVNVAARVAAPRPVSVQQQVIVTRVTRVVDAARPAPPKSPGQERQSQEVVVQRRYTIVSRLLPAPPRIPVVRQTQDVQVTRNAHVVRDTGVPSPRDLPRVQQTQQIDVRRSARVSEAPVLPAPPSPRRVDQTQEVRVERTATANSVQLPPVPDPAPVRKQQRIRVSRTASVIQAAQLPDPPEQPQIEQTQNVEVHRDYHLERGAVPRFAAPVPERIDETQDVVVHRETRLAQETVNLPQPQQPPPISEHQELTVRRTAHVEGPPPLAVPAAPAPVQQTQSIRVTRRQTATTQAAPAPEPPPTVQQSQDIVVHRETHFEESRQEQLPPAPIPAPIHQTQQIDVRRQQHVSAPPALEPPQQPPSVKQTQGITVERQIHATGGQLLKPADPPRVHQTQEIDVDRETHLVGESATSLPAPHPPQPIHETQQVTVHREVALDQRAQTLDLPAPPDPAPVQQTQDVDVRRQTRVQPTPPIAPPAPQPRVSQTQEIRVERRPHAVDQPLSAPAAPATVQQTQNVTVTRQKRVQERPLPPPINEAPVQQTQEIIVDRNRKVGRTSPTPRLPNPPPDVRQDQTITIDRKTVVHIEPTPALPQAPQQVTQRQTQEVNAPRQARQGAAGAPDVALVRAEFDRLVGPVIEQAVRHFGRPEDVSQLPQIVADELEKEFERFTAQASQHVAAAPTRQAGVRRVAESLRELPSIIRRQFGNLPEVAGSPRPSAELEQTIERAIYGTSGRQAQPARGQQGRVVVVERQQTPATPPAIPRATAEPREPSPSRVFTRPTRTYAYSQRGDDQQLQVGTSGGTLSTFLGPNVPPEVRQLTRSEAAQRLRFQRNQRLPQGFNLSEQETRRRRRELRGSTPPRRVLGPEEVLARSAPSTVTQATPVIFDQPPANIPPQQPLPPAPRVIEPPVPASRRTPLPPAPRPFTPGPGQRVVGLTSLGPTTGRTAATESIQEGYVRQPPRGFTSASIGDDAPYTPVPTGQLFRTREDAERYLARQGELERRAQATGRPERTFQYERLGQQNTLRTGLNPVLQREGRLPQQISRTQAAQILASNRARIAASQTAQPVEQAPQRPALNPRQFAEATHVLSLENQGRAGRQYFVPPGRLNEALQQILPRLTGNTVASLQQRDPRTEVLGRDVQLTRADVEQRLAASQQPATQQQPISIRSAVEISTDIDRLTRSIRRQVDQVTRQRRVATSAPAIAAAQAATVRLAESRTRLEELGNELRAATTLGGSQQASGIAPGVARLRNIQGSVQQVQHNEEPATLRTLSGLIDRVRHEAEEATLYLDDRNPAVGLARERVAGFQSVIGTPENPHPVLQTPNPSSPDQPRRQGVARAIGQVAELRRHLDAGNVESALATARGITADFGDRYNPRIGGVPEYRDSGTPPLPPGVERLKSIQGRAGGTPQQQPVQAPPGFFPLQLPTGETVLLSTGTASAQAQSTNRIQPRDARGRFSAQPAQAQQSGFADQGAAATQSAASIDQLSAALTAVSGKETDLTAVLRTKNDALRAQALAADLAADALLRLSGVVTPLSRGEESLAQNIAAAGRAQQTATPRASRRPRQVTASTPASTPEPQPNLAQRVEDIRTTGLEIPATAGPAATTGPLIIPGPRGNIRTGAETQQRLTEATRPRTLQDLGLVGAGPQTAAPQSLILPRQTAGPGPALALPSQPTSAPQPLILPANPQQVTPSAQTATISVAPVVVPTSRKQNSANNLFQQLVTAGMPVVDAAAQVQTFFGITPTVAGAPPPPPLAAPATARPTRAQNLAQQQIQQRLAIATGAPFSTVFTPTAGRLVAPPGFTVPSQFQSQFVRPGGALGRPLTATGVPIPETQARGQRPLSAAGAASRAAALGLGEDRPVREGGTQGRGALSELGIGALNPARIALGLAGIPVGLNVLAGLARQVHDATVGIIHDTDSLVQSFREIGIAYGQLGQQQVTSGFARFNADPSTRGTVEQYTRSAAALRDLSQQYGFSTQQITGVIDVAGRLSKIYAIDLPQASSLLDRSLQGDAASAQQLGLNLTDNQGRLRSVGVSYETLAGVIGRSRAAQVLFNDIQAELASKQRAAAESNDKTADSIDRIGKAADQAKSFLTNLVSAPYKVIVEAVANIVGGIQQTSDVSDRPEPIGQPTNQQLANLRNTRPITHVGDAQQSPRYGGNLPGVAAYVGGAADIVGIPVPGINREATVSETVRAATSPLVAVGVLGGAFATPLVAPGQQIDPNHRPIARVQAPAQAQVQVAPGTLPSPSAPPNFGSSVTARTQELANQNQPQPPRDATKLDFGAAVAAAGLPAALSAEADSAKKAADANNKLITSLGQVVVANLRLIGTAQTLGTISERQARSQEAGVLAQAAQGPDFPLRTLTPEQITILAQQRASQATYALQNLQLSAGASDAARPALVAAASTRNPEAQAALQQHDDRTEAEKQIIGAQHDQAVQQTKTVQAQAHVDEITTQNEQGRLAAQQQVNDLTLAQVQLQGSLAPLLLEEANIRDQITLATRENLDLTERTLRTQQSAIPASRALESANFTEQQATQRAVVAAVDKIQGRQPSFDINEQIKTITGIEFQKPRLELNNLDAQRNVTVAQQAQSDSQLQKQIDVIPQQRRAQEVQDKEVPIQAASREVQAQSDALSRALQSAELSRAPALIEAQSELLDARLQEIHATLKLTQAQLNAAGQSISVTNNVTVPGNLDLSQDYVDRLSTTLTAATIQALLNGGDTAQRVRTSVPGGR
jgi:hypothetical protein